MKRNLLVYAAKLLLNPFMLRGALCQDGGDDDDNGKLAGIVALRMLKTLYISKLLDSILFSRQNEIRLIATSRVKVP